MEVGSEVVGHVDELDEHVGEEIGLEQGEALGSEQGLQVGMRFEHVAVGDGVLDALGRE